MPSKARYKTRGGKKDFASKNTFNPPTPGGVEQPVPQTREPYEQNPERQIGEFTGKGEPSLEKK